MRKHSSILSVILLVLLFQCSPEKIDQQTYDEVSGLSDSINIGDGKLTVYNVYKSQAISQYNKQAGKEIEYANVLVNNVYAPYHSMWEGYVGDKVRFLKWSSEKLKVSRLNSQASRSSKEGIDQLIKITAEKMFALTGRQAVGKWYVIFGPAWTDLGGIGNGMMVIDLGNPAVDKERISHLLPHELNHQIYGNSSKDTLKVSALFRCIDEGFATYVNQLYWGEKNAAKSLMYSESELQWCFDHEKELFREAKKYFSSTEKKHVEMLAARSQKLVQGGPGAQGYFIGYRICEEYVKKNGADSWKNIYDIPVSKLLELSGI